MYLGIGSLSATCVQGLCLGMIAGASGIGLIGVNSLSIGDDAVGVQTATDHR